MGKYIVIAIAMSAKNNRIAEHGEIVDESELNSPAHELLSGNFIRLATEEEIEASGQVVEGNDDSGEEQAKSEDAGDDKPKEATAEISKKEAVKAVLKSEK